MNLWATLWSMEPEDVEREFPGWVAWVGVGGLWYARYLKSAPALVLRANSASELREQIREWLAANGGEA